jgi:hypothetical protein
MVQIGRSRMTSDGNRSIRIPHIRNAADGSAWKEQTQNGAEKKGSSWLPVDLNNNTKLLLALCSSDEVEPGKMQYNALEKCPVYATWKLDDYCVCYHLGMAAHSEGPFK